MLFRNTRCTLDHGPTIFFKYPTLIALNYFCKIHEDQRVFHFETIKNVLVSSFRFICYGSTATRNIFTLTVRGSTLDVRI